MATITPIQRRDGVVYKARIRKPGQAIVTKTFKYRSDAEKWARKAEGEIERDESGLTTEAHRHTLADAIDRYQRERLPELAEGTRVAYQAHQKFWRDKLGHLRLSQLRPAVIAKARDELLEEKGVSKASANRYAAALQAVLARAQRVWYWIAANPVGMVRKLEEPPGRQRYLTQGELDKLLETCRESASPDLYLLVLIGVTTGARLGEISNLRWSAVDLDRDLFHFRVGNVNAIKGEVRAVPIAPPVKALLQARQAARKAAKVVALRDDALVFPSTVSARQPINCRDSWGKATARAGLEGFHFHDLRHSCASFLAAHGASLLEIGKVLGHKTPSTTARYSHLTADHSHTLVNEVTGKLLGTPSAPTPPQEPAPPQEGQQ